MSLPPRGLQTLLVHAGARDFEGAVTTPIFQSATYRGAGGGLYEDVRYARLSNTPNHEVLDARLSAITGAEAALVTTSGMAAISATLMTLLSGPRRHALVQSGVYGGTHGLLGGLLGGLGVEVTELGPDPAGWDGLVRPDTALVYVEALTNPLVRVIDLEAVVSLATRHGLTSVIDATFATPVNLRPAAIGFDLEVHSATKYLAGHSDVVAGAVMGRRALVDRVRSSLGHLGGSLDPHACFLLERGMKTLGLRVAQQNRTALALARALEGHPAVSRVHHPGLEGHPDHGRAARWLSGCGGVLSFELHGGASAAVALLDGLTLACVAPSLGGIETLVTRPAATSHAGMSAQDRARAGITDGLVRVAVGIEDTQDVCDDFARALDALAPSSP